MLRNCVTPLQSEIDDAECDIPLPPEAGTSASNVTPALLERPAQSTVFGSIDAFNEHIAKIVDAQVKSAVHSLLLEVVQQKLADMQKALHSHSYCNRSSLSIAAAEPLQSAVTSCAPNGAFATCLVSPSIQIRAEPPLFKKTKRSKLRSASHEMDDSEFDGGSGIRNADISTSADSASLRKQPYTRTVSQDDLEAIAAKSLLAVQSVPTYNSNVGSINATSVVSDVEAAGCSSSGLANSEDALRSLPFAADDSAYLSHPRDDEIEARRRHKREAKALRKPKKKKKKSRKHRRNKVSVTPSLSDGEEPQQARQTKHRNSMPLNEHIFYDFPEKSKKKSMKRLEKERNKERRRSCSRSRSADSCESSSFQSSSLDRSRKRSRSSGSRSSDDDSSGASALRAKAEKAAATLEEEKTRRIQTFLDSQKSLDKERFTLFFTKKYPFSNHHECSLDIEDLHFNCTEQYYMFIKAASFNDDVIAMEILKSDDPKRQKQLSKQIKDFNAEKWGAISYDTMWRANEAKYTQNQSLRTALFKTVGTTLVEANPSDCHWGIGLAMNHPDAFERSKWRGKNVLGELLTKLRDQLMLDKRFHDEALRLIKQLRRKTL